jgi:hypothetical protein
MRLRGQCFGLNRQSKATIALLCVFVAAVALPQSKSDIPLLADGTVNFGATSGDPGVWELTYVENIADYMIPSPGVSPRRGAPARSASAEPHVPFLPWSAALYNYNVHNQAKYDPAGYCIPPAGPRLFAAPYPVKIIQLPDQKRVYFIFETHHTWREVFMDGRPHPAGMKGSWLGHSVGRYEDNGKTLVIDVAGFNDETWLDFAGHPHTSQLHLVEKFTRPSKNQLRYEVTIDDPGAYARPWTVSWTIKWWPEAELDEYICEENNQYIHTLKDDFGRPMFPAR